MTTDDRWMTGEYQGLVGSWRELTAVALGHVFTDDGCMYDAYVWFLVARALGEPDAQQSLEELENAELVSSEDRFLANLQVAIWFQRGLVVDADPAHALARLYEAAMPFLALPTNEELAAAEDVAAARDAAWATALDAFGFPGEGALVDEPTIAALVAKILANTGWPRTLDFTLPLGPATPDRPWWIHPRHPL